MIQISIPRHKALDVIRNMKLRGLRVSASINGARVIVRGVRQ